MKVHRRRTSLKPPSESFFYPSALKTAWSVIRDNGLQSKSSETRRQIQQFSVEAERNIDRIYRQLRNGRFGFRPATGILASRPNKAPRPIAIYEVEERIVQRSLLDAITLHSGAEQYISVPTSFGGLRGRGVRQAIEAGCKAIAEGARFFLRSDIEAFFTAIPRQTAIQRIVEATGDNALGEVLERATRCELENLAKLREGARYFPTHDLGVAQGCCLSPLMGNVLLKDFDRALNGRGIACLRYIDDFLILGAERRSVRKAFVSALELLGKFGLRAYDPEENREKAESGQVHEGFEFLGCEIKDGVIRPIKKSQSHLLESIDAALAQGLPRNEGSTQEGNAGKRRQLHDEYYRRSLTGTLRDVSNILRGWGNQYSFCNDSRLVDSIDRLIDEKIADFLERFRVQHRRLGDTDLAAERRRLLGVFWLGDSKSDPVYPLHKGKRTHTLSQNGRST